MFVQYDAEYGPGESVAERYKVNSYPSLLVLDASGMLCQKGNDHGDRPAALAQLTHAASLETSRTLRSHIRTLYRRVELEGGPLPLDGVDAITPLLAPTDALPSPLPSTAPSTAARL